MSRKEVKKRQSTTNRQGPDKGILFFLIIMAIFGAIMIYDASVYQANQLFKDQFYFLKQQVLWLFIGTIPAFFFYFIDYRKLLKLALPGLITIIILLILVLVFGEEVNGSKRWFQIGPIPPIQPAEFAKIIVVMYFSSWLAKREHSYTKFEDALKKGFGNSLLGFIAILGVVAVLILLEPDLGTTMIICVTAFAMFFVSGKDKAHSLGSFLMIFLLLPIAAIAAILEPYRLSRVQTFLNLILTGEVSDPRGSGYQMQQILIGIGSGGFWGKGFGQSRQRFGYLVENTAFTDSIFAVVLEELGLWGGAIIVFSWIFFLWRGFKIAMNAIDREGQLLAAGITIWLTCQAFFNMAANVGLIPLTGIPLPFLTYGGSSTIVTLMAFGLLLNVSRYAKQK
ncbi:stage V sporulation protein E [Candidatus Dojkabacteria bacterium HGW-Dojkabacteria-1]|uniref:Probable peptidoglycan glycosyltransferase FtsW n=1 Tax=Candidatus Dojkabacteria bacterium HGW-Dojkabacteria-1 TaxID=2013761 RepID=A0A2N2F3V9_9BACT|nr:MAG: stage V sporulation protein E [Candidatus Dojkabacteria bacterium HGW-Dojkabacteria-1]